MATISLIVGLMGLTVAGYALYRCRRMRGGMSRIESDLLTSEQKHQLFEGVAAVHPLGSQLDRLRCSLNEELQKLRLSVSQLDEKTTQIEHILDELQVAGNQLDDRLTQIEKACSGLGAMSEDLDTLKDFSENTERLHNRLREALNGDSVKTQPLASKPQIGLSRRA